MLQEAVKPLLALRCIGQRILPALLVGMAYISRNHSLKTTDVVVATVRGLLPACHSWCSVINYLSVYPALVVQCTWLTIVST
jgi:hypothetical protein